MKNNLPMELYDRVCDECHVPFWTAYSPERPEKILCEECYRKLVYQSNINTISVCLFLLVKKSQKPRNAVYQAKNSLSLIVISSFMTRFPQFFEEGNIQFRARHCVQMRGCDRYNAFEMKEISTRENHLFRVRILSLYIKKNLHTLYIALKNFFLIIGRPVNTVQMLISVSHFLYNLMIC